MAILVIEGRFIWTSDGTWLESRASHRQYTKAMYWGLRFSASARGIVVIESSSLSDTRDMVEVLGRWLGKQSHPEAWRRPNPERGDWGQRTSRDWMLHLLMGFETLGPTLAGRIVDRYPRPLAWTVTTEDLCQVEGIGKLRAERLIGALGD
jgi:ERCC4-type nuclease